jgi:hypothetical protein
MPDGHPTDEWPIGSKPASAGPDWRCREMADRALAIRLAVVDGGKVKVGPKDVGEVGDRALHRIEAAARPAPRTLLALDGAAGEVCGSLQGLAGRLGPLGTALAALGPASLPGQHWPG